MIIVKGLKSLARVRMKQSDNQKNCLRRGRVCYILNLFRVCLEQI